jgi:hypothetical protein
MVELHPLDGQSRYEAPDNLDGMNVHGRSRQAIADDNRKPARAAASSGQ